MKCRLSIMACMFNIGQINESKLYSYSIKEIEALDAQIKQLEDTIKEYEDQIKKLKEEFNQEKEQH